MENQLKDNRTVEVNGYVMQPLLREGIYLGVEEDVKKQLRFDMRTLLTTALKNKMPLLLDCSSLRNFGCSHSIHYISKHKLINVVVPKYHVDAHKKIFKNDNVITLYDIKNGLNDKTVLVDGISYDEAVELVSMGIVPIGFYRR